jgi:THO complex subunit 3
MLAASPQLYHLCEVSLPSPSSLHAVFVGRRIRDFGAVERYRNSFSRGVTIFGMTAFSGLATRIAIGHKKAVTALRWTCDGACLAAGGDKSGIRIFDTERLLQRDLTQEADSRVLIGHSNNIDHIVSSPNNPSLLVSAGADKLVNMYDLRSGASPVRFCSTDSPNINMDWSPDAKHLAVGDREDKLYFIDAGTMEIFRKTQQDIEVNQMRWNRSGSFLLLACGDGGVQIVSWPDMQPKYKLRGHRDRCYSVACDPTGQRFAVTSNDTCVSVWSASTFTCLFTIDRADLAMRLADYSHDGQLLATAGLAPRVDVSVATTGGLVHSVATPLSVVDLQWHPKKRLLAYCVEEELRRPSSAQSRMYANSIPPPKTYVYGVTPSTAIYGGSARLVR